MTSQIIRNKTDWSKWVTFFEDMAHGKIPHSSTGYYIVDQNPEWSKNPKPKLSNEPVINLVTPVAQTLEQAKADLKEEKSISRGRKRKSQTQAKSIRGTKHRKKQKEVADRLS